MGSGTKPFMGRRAAYLEAQAASARSPAYASSRDLFAAHLTPSHLGSEYGGNQVAGSSTKGQVGLPHRMGAGGAPDYRSPETAFRPFETEARARYQDPDAYRHPREVAARPVREEREEMHPTTGGSFPMTGKSGAHPSNLVGQMDALRLGPGGHAPAPRTPPRSGRRVGAGVDQISPRSGMRGPGVPRTPEMLPDRERRTPRRVPEDEIPDVDEYDMYSPPSPGMVRQEISRRHGGGGGGTGSGVASRGGGASVLSGDSMAVKLGAMRGTRAAMLYKEQQEKMKKMAGVKQERWAPTHR